MKETGRKMLFQAPFQLWAENVVDESLIYPSLTLTQLHHNAVDSFALVQNFPDYMGEFISFLRGTPA